MEADYDSKFILCVLMTQMGKTFTVIERIFTEIEQDAEFGRSVHIVFTMNTLLGNSQFTKRLQSLEEKYGRGSICVLSSIKKGCKYTHVKNRVELQGLCIDRSTCPKVIVVCSNKTRFEDGVEFVETINENINMIHRLFVYYDELHAYITPELRGQIERMNSFEKVKGIIALTASPDKIWMKEGFWSKIRLIKLDFNDTNYVGYQDMRFHPIDDFFPTPYIRPSRFDYDELDAQTIRFIDHVLTENPDILAPGTRSFIPAHVRRIGHLAVRNLIFQYASNAVVITINGVEKHLEYRVSPSDEEIKKISLESRDSEEVCETIMKVVLRNALLERPLVVTGFLCVGMGQTLVHQRLGSFTSAIFGHMDLTNDEIYQLFGRITGRMKNWGDSYKQTHVYCPTTIMHRCYVMEECARNMATEHNGEVVSQEDYREPMEQLGEIGQAAKENIRKTKEKKAATRADDTDRDYCVFDTQEEAIQFGYTMDISFRRRSSNKAPVDLLQNGSNPTVEYIMDRFWGISDKNPARMMPTIDNKWCVYWRPSLCQIKMESSGEEVTTTIPPKTRPRSSAPKKRDDRDRDFRVFDTQDEAIQYASTMGVTIKKSASKKTPDSIESIIEQFWGITPKNPARIKMTNENKWCLYWRPSYFVDK